MHSLLIKHPNSCLGLLNRVASLRKVSIRSCSSALNHEPQNKRASSSQLLFNGSKLNNALVLNSVDMSSRNFASLALFGLWGKKSTAPDKPIPNLDPNIQPTPPPPSPDAAGAAISSATKTEAVVEKSASNVYENTGYIPEPPAIMDDNLIMNALGEPTLQSLGLGSYYTPVGWIQNMFEYMHVDIGLPWYQVIILFAVCLRAALLPITIKSQRNASLMRKVGPAMQQLNERINDARLSGNAIEVARRTHEYQQFMTNSGLKITSFLTPFAQFPFVISTFLALRKMCKLPVESMMTGGLLWFQDLTIADPYYVLPVFATLSILAVVQRGIDTGVSAANMSFGTKAIVYGMTSISLPFFLFMPNGVMVYVCTTNMISLGLSVILGQDSIKRMLKIPTLTASEIQEMKAGQKKQKNFLGGLKESIKNQRLMAEVKDREQLREKQFTRAGTSVPTKTFKQKPTTTTTTTKKPQ